MCWILHSQSGAYVAGPMPDAYNTFCWNWMDSFSKKWLCSVLSCSRSLLLAQLQQQKQGWCGAWAAVSQRNAMFCMQELHVKWKSCVTAKYAKSWSLGYVKLYTAQQPVAPRQLTMTVRSSTRVQVRKAHPLKGRQSSVTRGVLDLTCLQGAEPQSPPGIVCGACCCRWPQQLLLLQLPSSRWPLAATMASTAVATQCKLLQRDVLSENPPHEKSILHLLQAKFARACHQQVDNTWRSSGAPDMADTVALLCQNCVLTVLTKLTGSRALKPTPRKSGASMKVCVCCDQQLVAPA
jgi:hypothetical protein